MSMILRVTEDELEQYLSDKFAIAADLSRVAPWHVAPHCALSIHCHDVLGYSGRSSTRFST